MSVELIVEVLKYAPASLTPTEKLLLAVIAESCSSKTRMTWYRDGWDAEEVARRTNISAGSLSKTFWSLAQKGCEVRVPHGFKDGKPIFAFRGKQTTFKLPNFAPERSDEDRTFPDGPPEKGPTVVGESPDEDRTISRERSDEDRTLLLKELPSKNTSSLSPRETEQPSATAVPAPRTERENEEAPPTTKNTKPGRRHTILTTHGLTDDEHQQFANWADQLPGGPKGDGWYIACNNNGTLTDRITDWRNSGQRASTKGRSNWALWAMTTSTFFKNSATRASSMR